MIRTLAAALATSTCLIAIATPAAAQTREFDVPAGSLRAALDTFARQSGRQVVYRGDEVRSARSPGVHGARTAEEALSAIVAGSGFVVKTDRTGAFAIVKEGNAPAIAKTVASPTEQSTDIVVTGTHIQGAPPTSPVLEVTKRDIERSGYQTSGEIIRSLPQSFSGGTNPGVVGAGGLQNQQDVGSASSANLRGLGPGSTLTLLDGHRIAPGDYANAVDISAIPLAALSRIEILTDGASSIYGSDAVAGVVNFILQPNYQGAETSAQIGTSTDGGATQYTLDQLFGHNWRGGNLLLNYQHSRQSALNYDQRDISSGATGPLTLLPRQNGDSAIAKVSQSLSPAVSVYAEGLYGNRRAYRASNSGTPFFNFSDSTLFDGIGGFDANIGDRVKVSAEGGYSKSTDKRRYYFNQVEGSGTQGFYKNDLTYFEGRIAGRITDLPGGSLSIATGAGYRRQSFSDDSGDRASRSVYYGYAELNAPIISPANSMPLVSQLTLSASARIDKYSDFGRAVTPKAGFLYSPTLGLTFKGTWSRSFKAPDLLQVYGDRQVYIFDGSSFGSSPDSQVLFRYGGNPNLKPERASSITLTADAKPQVVPNLRLTATYFSIRYHQRITAPVDNFFAALTNTIYAPFVSLDPSASAQQQVINASTFFADDSSSGYNAANAVAIIDDRYQNASGQTAQGVDLSGSYWIEAGPNRFEVDGNASWLHIRQKLTPNSPDSTISGFIFNPPSFKARVGVIWTRGSFTTVGWVNHISGETDATSGSPVSVGSFTTLDLLLAKSLQGERWRISVSAQNLLNSRPPRIAASSTPTRGIGYDAANYPALGRFVSLSVTKKW